MAQRANAQYGVSIRIVCRAFTISETCYRYQAKLNDENAIIADWLLRLTTTHKRWGFGLCYWYLRNTQGYGWNHKRIYRIYRELELNLRIKPKRRIKRDKPDGCLGLFLDRKFGFGGSVPMGIYKSTFIIDDINKLIPGIRPVCIVFSEI